MAAEHTCKCPCSLSDGIIANGKEEMTVAVRKEIKHGSDWIKLLVTGKYACTHVCVRARKTM